MTLGTPLFVVVIRLLLLLLLLLRRCCSSPFAPSSLHYHKNDASRRLWVSVPSNLILSYILSSFSYLDRVCYLILSYYVWGYDRLSNL